MYLYIQSSTPLQRQCKQIVNRPLPYFEVITNSGVIMGNIGPNVKRPQDAYLLSQIKTGCRKKQLYQYRVYEKARARLVRLLNCTLEFSFQKQHSQPQVLHLWLQYYLGKPHRHFSKSLSQRLEWTNIVYENLAQLLIIHPFRN